MSAVIKTTQLTKMYGTQKAVDNLDMNVRQGQIYGFLGQNGAGKTTTIRMLLGLIKPTHGEIEIFGESLHKHQKEILRRIGSIVEFSGFYENLTARENLLINAKLMGVHKKNAMDEALEIVGLHQETKKLVGSYSLGMKQRLGIARAILHHPELLILDEPTNGLDPVGIKEIRRLIKSLAEERKITILVSSHILSEVEQLADQIGVVHQGKLLEEISFEELRKRNRKYLEFQVSDDNKAAMLLEKHFGITDYEVHDERVIRIYSHIGEQGKLNRMLVEHGIEVTKMTMSVDRLEDYFIQLIGGGTIG
ncbi:MULTISPECIES: ABC transporter ATP-binding protein [Paenibacillus]|uniref:ABC transporter ATP-binding protein n=1 Tax=Paenibacillus oleatilyticus TaxID=2594886 RepID=A0ABV4UWN2_9BACL|nr:MULTISPECIES: ABC transporter ATP-binding protein [Paenibacillus]MBU7318367.1 ABC transporter ATP-binding protein [Paenibacillus oleatilyticus]GLI09027.1 bacitracin ABC transporter ATP-binding protein [Paenibacillus tyrfis]